MGDLPILTLFLMKLRKEISYRKLAPPLTKLWVPLVKHQTKSQHNYEIRYRDRQRSETQADPGDRTVTEYPRTYLSKKARSDVPGTGIEPVRMLLHWCLRPTRLPIPPPGLTWWQRYDIFSDGIPMPFCQPSPLRLANGNASL